MSAQDVKDKIAEAVRPVVRGFEGDEPVDLVNVDEIVQAVATALGLDEPRHKVRLSRMGGSIEHPVHERLDGSLFDCKVFQYLRDLDDSPQPLGDYWVRVGAWDDRKDVPILFWERIEEPKRG